MSIADLIYISSAIFLGVIWADYKPMNRDFSQNARGNHIGVVDRRTYYRGLFSAISAEVQHNIMAVSLLLAPRGKMGRNRVKNT